MTTVYPHRIRLRGPWQCEPLPGGGTGAPAGRRVTLPCRPGERGLSGRLRFRRRFGYPGRIDAEERVWLTFACVGGAAEVWLNGERLGRHADPAGPFEHEVTARLGPRNELVIEAEAPGPGFGPWGDVALEVRRTAFLRGLRAWLSSEGPGRTLRVAGEVVGTSDGPLEVYALLGGRTVLYAPVETAAEGRTFCLASGPLDAGPEWPDAVRVDLVQGAVVWYAAEVPLLARAL